ncbi:MAG: protein translocase subunit SecF [Myxococcota bacterium]|nr:protein translocase subunit SecF [Myxococcota bacterium]
MKIMQGEADFDFSGKRDVFVKLSATACLLSVLFVGLFGLNFGIDFAGGYELQVEFPKDFQENEVKDLLAPLGLSEVRVQRFGGRDSRQALIMIREQGSLDETKKAQVRAGLEAIAGGAQGILNWVMAESGESITVQFGKPVGEGELETLVAGLNLKTKNILKRGRDDKPEYQVEIVSVAGLIESALRAGYEVPESQAMIQRAEYVGPHVGEELRNQGVLAIIYALGFILIYVAIRFDLAFAPGAIIALLHDVLITIGVFALFQIEFNLPIIAAILTVVGYSLNDTIVVYDRIRENALRFKGRPATELVNSSVNQTLSRTLLTSVTTLLVVAALLLMGGGIIRDFSIALAIGVIVGTYSSVGVAAMTYEVIRERQEGKTPATNERRKVATAH